MSTWNDPGCPEEVPWILLQERMSGDNVHKREILFKVNCSTLPGEIVCVSGDCQELGNWQLDNLVVLHQEDDAQEENSENSQLWSTKVYLPVDSEILFRYVVCVAVEVSERRKSFIVRRWETNILPRRIINLNNGKMGELEHLSIGVVHNSTDEFGIYGGRKNVELGWITSETVVQLKLYNSPIEVWHRKYKDSTLRLKMLPVPLSGDSLDLEIMDDFHVRTMKSNYNNREYCPRVDWPFIEIAVMNKDENQMSIQHQFGRAYQPEEMVIFQAKVSNYKNVAYMIDFYLDGDEEIPSFIGFSHILPCNLKGSNGYATLPIINVHQQPVGQIKVEYSIITPISDSPCDLSASYSTYWPETWTGLDVGHRGAGNSSKTFKSCSNIRENTIASFIKAAEHGADFVEFDVQLSKDLVPVLFHDFYVNISLHQKAKKGGTLTTLKAPVQDLTVSQLQDLKVTHLSEEPGASDDDLTLEHDPFPTLQQVLETVPVHTGFNIEVKWSMLRKNGSWDGVENTADLNLALDIILKVLFQYAHTRPIILSCFHPVVCTMLRLKQNKYPVLFLTQGVTEKWPEYDDPRTRSIPMAIYHALNTQVLGLCIHTEEILRDPSQLKDIVANGLIAFCWGDDNNDSSTIKYLKQLGLNGVIYDRIDDHIEAKKNIFESERNPQPAN